MQDIKKVLSEIKDSSKVKKVIFDTDTYNEVDDQFALALAILSDKIDLLSINAAPFHNTRSTGPADGMEKSYNEILNILSLMGKEGCYPVYRGSTEWLSDRKIPVESDAARNIVSTVMGSTETVYIIAIGAITNVASALIIEPAIAEKAVLVWLGGHATHWPHSREFNMVQDVKASQVVFDSGIPLLQIPCCGMCDHLTTTIPELEYYLRGKNALCDYLVDIVKSYPPVGREYGWSKVLWDVSAVAAIVLPNSLDTVIRATPILTDNCLYAYDDARHPMIYARNLGRDAIFECLFKHLTK